MIDHFLCFLSGLLHRIARCLLLRIARLLLHLGVTGLLHLGIHLVERLLGRNGLLGLVDVTHLGIAVLTVFAVIVLAVIVLAVIVLVVIIVFLLFETNTVNNDRYDN